MSPYRVPPLLHFDDTLTAVLAARPAAAWRQLVDLVARGRVVEDAEVLGRLAALAGQVPVAARAAAARAAGQALPPPGLVRLFARDVPVVARPMLQTATLPVAAWIALLPELGPEARGVLRHRRDLPNEVVLALESYAPLDYVLPAGEGGGGPVVETVRSAAPPADGAAERFRFATDAGGTIRWCDAVGAGSVIGASLARLAGPGRGGVDGTVAGAFARRGAFDGGRLVIAAGTLAGRWRISARAAFDAATGRYTGHVGAAVREREGAAADPARAGADAMRVLVHELRTPITAIQGFAELIAGEVLGAVAAPYRAQADAIRRDGERLLSVIETIDTAVQGPPSVVESLPLRETIVAAAKQSGGAVPAVPVAAWPDAVAFGEARAITRIVAGLMRAGGGAVGRMRVDAAAGERIALTIVRGDDDGADEAFPLALLARAAAACGGSLTTGRRSLTLYLPGTLDPRGERRRREG